MGMRDQMIAAGKEQFTKQRELLGPIDVPEWEIDGKPAQIWVKPMTMREKDMVSQSMQKGYEHLTATTVVVTARGADGLKLFKHEDVDVLLDGFQSESVARVCTEIGVLLKPSEEAVEKLGN